MRAVGMYFLRLFYINWVTAENVGIKMVFLPYFLSQR